MLGLHSHLLTDTSEVVVAIMVSVPRVWGSPVGLYTVFQFLLCMCVGALGLKEGCLLLLFWTLDLPTPGVFQSSFLCVLPCQMPWICLFICWLLN
jgi:hypothetical protein